MSGYGRPPFNSVLLFKRPSLALRKVLQFGDTNGAEAAIQDNWFWGSTGTQTLTPSLYTNTNQFYSPTVTSTATVQPARYDNTNVFYPPTVSASNTLTPARYDNSQVFYGPTVTSTATIAPARYDNTNVFYSPTVSLGTSILYPDRFDNTNTFYAASIINEYPDPSQVLEGVHYGPGGILVGTLTGGGGSSIIRLRSFTERH